ncbi:hypothetical protein [Streptomyces sp. NPDC006645]
MAATITPETDQPEITGCDTETTIERERGRGDMAEPLDLVGGLFAA